MTTFKMLASVASVGVLLCAPGAFAQEATQAPAPSPGSECSGIHCILGWHLDSAPAQPSPPEQESRSVASTAPLAGTHAKRAKPVHIVTIAAAAGPEASRLAGLNAALPKAKVRIVRSDKRETESDFSVSTSLDRPSSASGARLFTEQLHIVAGGNIHSLNDLNGKVVSFGPDKSPSQVAARKAFEALNIKVQETPLDLDNALDGLTTGDLEAVVVLAPQPVARLKTVSAPGVHLVSWPDGGTLPYGASASKIDAAAYPGLIDRGASIKAMGVQVSLLPNARGAKDPAAKTFLKALSENSDALAKRGFDLIKADAAHDRHFASADR